MNRQPSQLNYKFKILNRLMQTLDRMHSKKKMFAPKPACSTVILPHKLYPSDQWTYVVKSTKQNANTEQRVPKVESNTNCLWQ